MRGQLKIVSPASTDFVAANLELGPKTARVKLTQSYKLAAGVRYTLAPCREDGTVIGEWMEAVEALPLEREITAVTFQRKSG